VTPRDELIAIQKRIVDRLKDEIESSVGRIAPAVTLYYEEYWKEFETGYGRVSSKRELLQAAAKASILYCGDYHTLRQSQATALRLIEDLSREREVIVAIEMIAIEDQASIDAYLDGRLDDIQLLKAIDYANTWDFHWPPYRAILDFCRRRGLRVVGINCDPSSDRSDRILERDFRAAETIVRETEARPEALVFVFDGDLHVARDHLPLIVDSLLRRKRLERRRLIVHQNVESIYWRLAEEHLERVVDCVRLAEDSFCVLTATPLVKLQSYLNWEQNHAELSPVVHPDWRHRGDEDDDDADDADDAPDYGEQIHEIVKTIAGFLEIDEPGLDDFIVYTAGDLGFLEALERDPRFGPHDILEIKRQIAASESYFIPRANVIYLADLSLHRAAEEASHFLNTLCAGWNGTARPRSRRDAFYFKTIVEALGFFGSRIIDPKRACLSERDHVELVLRTKRKRLDLAGSEIRTMAREVLRHLAAERRYLRTRRFPPLRRLYEESSRVVDAAAHGLGYILGDKLYNAMIEGEVLKDEVRALFYEPFASEGDAFKTYLRWVERLNHVPHDHPVGSESFLVRTAGSGASALRL